MSENLKGPARWQEGASESQLAFEKDLVTAGRARLAVAGDSLHIIDPECLANLYTEYMDALIQQDM